MVKVRNQNENNRIRVSSSQSSGSISAYHTTDIIAEGLAKDWAVKMDGLVDNIDYSSKYYAAQAKSHKEISESSAQIATTQANLAKQYAEEAGTIVSAKIVPATETRLGGIKVGSNLSISEEGVLNTNANKLGVYEKSEVNNLLAQKLDSSSLPTNVSAFNNDVPYATQSSLNTLSSQAVMKTQIATASTLGIVKPDDNSIKIDGNGTLRTAYPDITPDNINQSKGALTGSISTNSNVLNDIKNYARSTFEASKFTVEGSPTITNDGIASGFSGSNYLKLPTNIGALLHNANSWKIRIKFKYSPTTQWARFITSALGAENKGYSIMQNINANSVFATISFDGTKQDGTKLYTDGYINGNVYILEAEFTGTSYELTSYNEDGSLFKKSTPFSSTQKIQEEADWWIGRSNVGAEFDLKQILITVDGIPVFSGNKTGIDTVKPDDYTVVGTPTISADGIANGFSTTSYLTFLPSSYNNSLEIDFAIIPDGNGKVDGIIGSFEQTSYKGIKLDNFSFENKTFRLWLSSDGSSYDICSNKSGTATNLTANVINYFRLIWNGVTYKLQHSLDNTYWNDVITQESTLKINTTYSWILGGSSKSDKLYGFTTNGSIDLNTFKIYVDGDLVYQPCLKIPYTESNTGSKIVNSIYRDRVNDMASQFGYANYYTLSDTDFTLPQGELYGLIEENFNIKYPTQKEKDTIISWGMPDWSKTVSKVSGTTYTASQRGWISASGNTSQGGIGIKINDIWAAYTEAQGADDTSGFACLVPVDIGDTYEGIGANFGIGFMPCKGEE